MQWCAAAAVVAGGVCAGLRVAEGQGRGLVRHAGMLVCTCELVLSVQLWLMAEFEADGTGAERGRQVGMALFCFVQ